MCHCTNEIYYSNGLPQSQCHKKIPLAGLMDSAVSTAMDPACQRRVNARPAADNRSSYLYISRYLCYHNFVLYYILYYTIISCALAHMESKVETVSFCFDIIPQFRAPWRTWNQKSKQRPSVSILYHNFVRSGAHGIKSRNSVLLFRYYTMSHGEDLFQWFLERVILETSKRILMGGGKLWQKS